MILQNPPSKAPYSHFHLNGASEGLYSPQHIQCRSLDVFVLSPHPPPPCPNALSRSNRIFGGTEMPISVPFAVKSSPWAGGEGQCAVRKLRYVGFVGAMAKVTAVTTVFPLSPKTQIISLNKPNSRPKNKNRAQNKNHLEGSGECAKDKNHLGLSCRCHGQETE
jgi:hypothetical protein